MLQHINLSVLLGPFVTFVIVGHLNQEKCLTDLCGNEDSLIPTFHAALLYTFCKIEDKSDKKDSKDVN